jgi:hypothetical protein
MGRAGNGVGHWRFDYPPADLQSFLPEQAISFAPNHRCVWTFPAFPKIEVS